MSREKIKVYIYTRVSTSMQIDGYSLDAQKSRMKAFCDFNDYEIAGEYEDAGKSGKTIEGRVAFNQMMEDIKTGKDEVSFVLVFKLSRFGRNAADVLASVQVMQDFGVNLICVEDGIDLSKDAGKLMISVLSAVAEIERENIRIQTMEVTDLIGDTFYKDTSVSGRISFVRKYAEVVIRKILDIDSNKAVTLGAKNIQNRIKNLPNHEFIEAAVETVRGKGNQSTHTQYLEGFFSFFV